jgi:hypothetical protein
MNTDKILRLHEVHLQSLENPLHARQKQKAAAPSRGGL